jgi:hypothetical protein
MRRAVALIVAGILLIGLAYGLAAYSCSPSTEPAPVEPERTEPPQPHPAPPASPAPEETALPGTGGF